MSPAGNLHPSLRAPQAAPNAPAILLLAPDDKLADLLPPGYAPAWTDSWAQAQRLLQQQDFALLLLDLALPGAPDRDPLARMALLAQRSAVVVLVAPGQDDLGLAAVRAGAQDCLVYGEFDAKRLHRALDYALARRQTAAQAASVAVERDFLASVVENAADAVLAYGVRGDTLIMNRVAREHFGLPDSIPPTNEWVAAFGIRRLDGTEMPLGEVPLYQALQGQSTRMAELLMAAPDGRRFRILASAQPMRDSNGAIIGAVVTWQDLDQRTRAEEALRASEELYRAVFTSALDPMMLFDDDWQYVAANEAAQALLGGPDELAQVRRGFLDIDQSDSPGRHLLAPGEQQGTLKLMRPGSAPRFLEYRSRANILPGLHLTTISDTTAITQTRQLAEREKQRLSGIAAISRQLSANRLDYAATLDTVGAATCELIGNTCVISLRAEGGKRIEHIANNSQGRALGSRLRQIIDQRGPGDLVDLLIAGGRSLRIPMVDSDFASSGLPGRFLPALQDAGVCSLLFVPLQAAGTTIGGLLLLRDGGSLAFSADDLGFLEQIADQGALALDNANMHSTTQQALHQHATTLAQLNTLLDSIPIGLAFRDTDLRYLRVNNYYANLFGWKVEDLIGVDVQTSAPGWSGLFEPLLRQVITTGKPIIENEFEGVPGSPMVGRQWLASQYPVMVGDQVIGVSSVLMDISERSRVAAALRQSEERYRQLVELSPLAIAVHTDQRYVYANNAALEMLGVASLDELRGRLIWDFVPPEVLPELRGQQFERNYQQPTIRTLQSKLLRADGQVRDVSFTSIPTVYGDKPAIQMVVRDITEQMRAEQEILARARAEAASLAKTEFLSRMSHELRTPLNAIIGFGQLLQEYPLTGDERECVDQILQGGRHLLTLINEVLDISRIEEGRLSLLMEPVLLREVLEHSHNMSRVMADQSHIHLSVNVRGAEGLHVRADRQRLIQVLLNLLSNAIKYNRSGGRAELTWQQDTLDERPAARITVSDTGIGIDPALMPRLFIPFDRLGAEQSDVEGTGLGLPLALRLTEAMDGEMGVSSLPGEGSRFWIKLPLTPNPAAQLEGAATADPAATVASAARQTLLYIEDNVSNQRLIARVLNRLPNVDLLIAGYGAAGLALADEALPKVILLDLHLPDIGGEEVLRRLRENPRTSHIPVIVISADATPLQIRRLRAAGAQDYLTKPLDVRQFMTVLEKMLALQEA